MIAEPHRKTQYCAILSLFFRVREVLFESNPRLCLLLGEGLKTHFEISNCLYLQASMNRGYNHIPGDQSARFSHRVS